MNLIRVFSCLLFILCLSRGVAQHVDSIKQLIEVEVSTSRLGVFSSASKTESYDSTFLSRYSNNNL
ncbi:MAG TPA: hypothetical protein VGC65_08090, partial [Bacteroidia bacterium]